MNKKDMELFKNRLEEMKKSVESQLSEVAEKSSHGENVYEAKFPQFGDTEDENIDEVTTFVDRLSIEENLETQLQGINLALEKIKKNKYGFCESCDKEIEEKRLEALPTARWCLECKEKMSK